MGGAAGHKVDHANDAIRPALVLEAGAKMWPPPAKVADATPAAKPAAVAPAAAMPARAPVTSPAPAASKGHGHGSAASAPSRTVGVVMSALGLLAAIAFVYLRYGTPAAATDAGVGAYKLLQHLTVFVMAIFVGMQVVWNVAPALHTPLMSVTNAISGIIVVGGIIGAKHLHGWHPSVVVAIAATLFATINIAGGFLVTRRMLAMFRK